VVGSPLATDTAPMITGHFAAALVPYARHPRLPLFLLLLLTQLQDFLIPVDVLREGGADLGRLEMTVSHDLLPVIVLALVIGGILHLGSGDRRVAWVGAGLVLAHEACDFVVGFSHHVFGPQTPRLGLDLYRTSLVTACAIEFVFAAGCIGYFLRARRLDGDPVPPFRAAVLSLAILGPVAVLAVLASHGLQIAD
jgi:hypothetical protein